MTAVQNSTIARLVSGVVRAVLVHPVLRGTLALRHRDRGVAGVVGVVAVLFACVLGAIVAARPLRTHADLIADTSGGAISVLPGFLPPALLLVVGVSFALVLAGSQRGHPAFRVLLLIVVSSILAAIAVASPGRQDAPWQWWGSIACIAATIVYSISQWWTRTPAVVDVLVLLAAIEGSLVLAYAGMVGTHADGGLRFDVVTVTLLVTYLTMLASPFAFASGLSAVGVGIAAVSWSADFLRRAARPLTLAVVLGVLAGWQLWTLHQRWWAGPAARIGETVAAAVVVAIAGVAWMVSRRPRTVVAEEVVERGVRLGLPVGYGLQSAVLATGVLGMIAVGSATLSVGGDRQFLARLIDFTSSDVTTAAVRWIVVAGLVAAGVIARKRGKPLSCGISWVSAVVLASAVLSLPGQPLSSLVWSPNSIGDIGVLAATAMAAWWTVMRRWTAERCGYLVIVVSLSALVRQANFLETPMAFVLGGSAVAVLVFGLAWSFLTGGADAHADSRWLSGDRRLLVFVGESLYALAITAWAVIGRQAEAAATLASFAALAVVTLGTALVLSSAFALAPFPCWQRKELRNSPRGALVDD